MTMRAVRARLVCSAALFACFVASLCWTAVCIVDGGKLLVVSVACMCMSLVSSFGMLIVDLVLSVPSSVPSSVPALGVIRTIRVGPMRPMRPMRPMAPMTPMTPMTPMRGATSPIGGAGPVVDEQGPSAPIGPIGPIDPVAGQILGTRLSRAVFRRATVFDDACVAIAVDASPSASSPSASAPSPKVCVFEPSSPYG